MNDTQYNGEGSSLVVRCCIQESGGEILEGTTFCSIMVKEKQTPNLECTLWQRHEKLIFHGILSSLSDSVIPMVSSLKTTVVVWNRLAKYYANPSSSQVMVLMDQLSKE
ncbi:hypothetical protein ACSBR1_015920 [Camellia fascicularis]